VGNKTILMEITANSFDCSAAYRAQLNALMAGTFGFTFDGWSGPLGWNADYISYAVMEQERLLAHAGVYRMDLRIHGTPRTAYQIGGVATRPEWRGQGLSRLLLEHILARQPGALFLLFANESVLNFYPRFGFTPRAERQPIVEIPAGAPSGGAGLRRLALDDPRVAVYLRQPPMFSAVLDCANAAPLHWFHLRLGYADCIYEVPALRAMLVARQIGDRLEIDGLWASERLRYADLAPYLAFPGTCRIHFGFNPDGLGAPYATQELAEPSGLHVRGDLGLRGEWIFPLLART
jgi:GNAT superfamily N-acetyltransferase